MKKLFVFCFLINISIGICYAQKAAVDILSSTLWQQHKLWDANWGIYFKYTPDSVNIYIILADTVSLHRHVNYYLSDSIETSFKTHKIGQAKSGKYFVQQIKDKTADTVVIHEIMYINEREFKLKLLSTELIIGSKEVQIDAVPDSVYNRIETIISDYTQTKK